VAVTQNLARLTGTRLAACATSVQELDAVCSFRALDPMDYLDLDWAPRLLQRVAEASGISPNLALALNRAMEGDGEVNPAYRDAPDSIWEHPVASLDAATVADVSASLKQLADVAPLTHETVGRAVVGLPRHDVPEQAFDYLKGHFDALCAFYADAANRGLAIIMWLD
jgi:hypothetical protein